MLIVGEREAEAGTVSLRKRDGSQQNGLSVAVFEALVQEKISSRAAEL